MGIANRCFSSKINILLTCMMLLISQYVFSQETMDLESSCPPKTLFELFKKKDSLLVVKPVKNSFFLVIPIIGSQPATGFMYGAVAQYTFKGKGINDKYSLANLGVVYTAKKQLMINVKNNILLKGNSWYLSGDYRFYIFTQANYGLGTGIIPSHDKDFSIESIAEPMDYNYLKFHQTVSYEVKDNFYIGGGINVDWYSDINDKLLDPENGIYTHHYNYSKKYDFNDKEYFMNGFSANVTFDSRDNQVNAKRGWFANLNYRMNPKIFDNQHWSNILYAEYRNFIPVSKKNENFTLALWAYGQFITRGRVPYLSLPAIGWDQRSRSGEGYTQGLFRGPNLIYFSTEFRFPITCNQLLGGTVFTNFVTASNKDENIHLFRYIQPAIGVGLRIMIDKATRTNLIADYAKGRHSDGFYLNAGETF
ncbi:BamA/TamA family outer membrane protein [Flavobacterium sp. AG291]|uniref:BamA/TamA family outer membrane protein n=1 Tax=Flavobacterium sp. AG291 TaxID=2184000 RepID=UPI000E0AAF2C|nr:BamA/TamA family outer membrane protein [Flavobacterium sp. AG291]